MDTKNENFGQPVTDWDVADKRVFEISNLLMDISRKMGERQEGWPEEDRSPELSAEEMKKLSIQREELIKEHDGLIAKFPNAGTLP